jgi:hypothetical protein
MITVDQIREKLRAVASKRLDLDRFDEWLSQQSWDMHQDSTEEAQKLVGKVELVLSDFDNGELNIEEVCLKFRGLAAIFEALSADASASPDNQMAVSQFEWKAASGKQPAAGFSYTPLLQS